MPALPAVPKVVQLAFQTTNRDIQYMMVNRLHFSYTGTAPTPGELSSFATTCLTAFGAAYAASLFQNYRVTGLAAIDLSSPTAATAEVTGAIDGTLTGVGLPADTAFVLSATVARRFRGGHPRSYLPLGDDTKLADTTTWTSAFVTAVETASAGLMTAIEGAGWAGAGTLAPVNVSYYEGYTLVTYPSGRSRDVPKLRVGGPVVDAVTGFVGRALIGTQRRRTGR